MSFLCPSVGLLKLRRFTKTGFAGPRTGKIRSNVRNRGTSVSFERRGSDVSLASQGGFSALYGDIGSGRECETGGRELERQESYAGVYVGGDAEKTLLTNDDCTKPQDTGFLSRDPATVQSFTFFEETFISSRDQHDVTNIDSIIDQTENNDTFKEQKTPAQSYGRDPRTTPSSSGSQKAHYNLPTWVRQRRCLPTLNEVDFDNIDAVSLGGFSMASEIGKDDNNNNKAAGEKASRSEVTESKNSMCRVKRTHSDDSNDVVFNDDQIQHPRHHHLQHPRHHHLHMNMIADDMKAMNVYSPKKTRRSESVMTDDSVFEREPLLLQNSPIAPKQRHSRIKKSPSMESLRRRSKKMGSFRRKEKQPVRKNLTKTSTQNINNENIEHWNRGQFSAVGSLVRSKPLYMRATSERALDPSAVKLRLESSTARKWRQTGERSPLSEATNVSRPRPSVCLRMEIIQRPVNHQDTHPGGSSVSVPPPAHRTTPSRSLQGSVKLPAGKLRPTPQRSNVKSRRRSSLRRVSTEVTNESPRSPNLTVKEENIDNIFITNKVEMKIQKATRNAVNREGFSNVKLDLRSVNSNTVKEYSNRGAVTDVNFEERHLDGSNKNRAGVQMQRLTSVCKSDPGPNDEIFGEKEDEQSRQITPSTIESSVIQIDEMNVHLETVIDKGTVRAEVVSNQPPKNLIHKPKFAANALKEAKIVSTTKMAPETTPGVDEDGRIPPLPVKMYKSASFTGSTNQTKEDLSATSATRSATNVRALQIPLSNQQKRKVRRSAPGNPNGRARHISAVEASREDIVKVVAAMKASLDSTTQKRDNHQEKGAVSRRTDIVKVDLGEAVAVYAFEARNEGDLSLDVGECVQVLNIDDSDWLLVKKHSKFQEEGFVPRIFLHMTSEEEPPSHHNHRDNLASSSGEQSLPKQLNHTSDSNSRHLAQQANPKRKSVPSDKQSTDQSAVDTFPSKTINQSHSSSSQNIPDCRFLQPMRKIRARPNKFNTNIRSQSSTPLIETYVVIEDYTAHDEDEVSVVEAEVVVVNSGQQREVDWMWVYVPRTEMFGFMPAFSARPLGFHYSDV
ncbi:uncharacterized protein [Asterias amurensis]|uniref:uncharacterized protein n=1 Tax=Asterias amurensis TaxID=7602 RepID=UPI003AB5B15F